MCRITLSFLVEFGGWKSSLQTIGRDQAVGKRTDQRVLSLSVAIERYKSSETKSYSTTTRVDVIVDEGGGKKKCKLSTNKRPCTSLKRPLASEEIDLL